MQRFRTIPLLAGGGLFIVLCPLAIISNGLNQVEAAYPPGFFNHTGCLYAYLQGDGSKYEVFVPEGTDSHYIGSLHKFSFDKTSACIDRTTPGSLKITLETDDNYFKSMNLEMKLRAKDKEHNWEISEAKLTTQSTNEGIFPSTTVDLKSNSGDIYAGLKQSYSCSSLVLQHRTSSGHQIKLTLRRFQVQPFHEPGSYVFASSHDCSSWLTLPQIMGFALILFIIVTVLLGVYLLIELGGHSSDLRFSKQGGMLMNQAQLDATKAD